LPTKKTRSFWVPPTTPTTITTLSTRNNTQKLPH
jgi:hypothetical protein